MAELSWFGTLMTAVASSGSNTAARGTAARMIAAVVAAVAGMAATTWALHVRRRARPALRPGVSDAVIRLLQRGRRKLLSNVLDAGGFFGVDIGGSLTKMVFFLPDAELVDRMVERGPAEHVKAGHWRDKVQALRDVAAFMLSTDSYGGTGVRDSHLSFHIRELGGSFHFIRCVARERSLRVRTLRRAGARTPTISASGCRAVRTCAGLRRGG